MATNLMSYTSPEEVRLRTYNRTPSHYENLFSSGSTKFHLPPKDGFGMAKQHSTHKKQCGCGQSHEKKSTTNMKIASKRKEGPSTQKNGAGSKNELRKKRQIKSKYTLF